MAHRLLEVSEAWRCPEPLRHDEPAQCATLLLRQVPELSRKDELMRVGSLAVQPRHEVLLHLLRPVGRQAGSDLEILLVADLSPSNWRVPLEPPS